jgi:hypothetical protein
MNLRISEIPSIARLGLLGLLAGLALLCLEAGGADQRAWFEFPSPMARPLPADLTRVSLAAALGGEARVAADWGYIDCLQYMAGPYVNDGYWKDVLPLYSEVQWLDPSFTHAVREGISALGWLYRRPEQAEQLAEAALAADKHELGYGAYIAALAYQKHLDPKGVLAALEPEVQRPDAPEMLLRMYGNLLLKQGDWPRSLAYWTWVEARAQDPDTLAMAKQSEILARRHLKSGPTSTRP